jgi:signal transduction histidine kinase
MGADESLAQRLAFSGLGAEDRAALADLEPVLERHADRLVGAFYRHLLSFDETRRLLADPDVKRRLMAKQRAYLLGLARPSLDADYVQERVKIGRVHAQVGLETRWYLGAYALYFSLLAPMIFEAYPAEPRRSERALTALVRVLFFDAQLAIDAYFERRERQLEYLNRELAATSLELRRRVEDQDSELREVAQRARVAEELASVATLAAGLAHEIGTPMGVIRGHAELLEKSVTDDRGRWRLATIQEQIDRITRIIGALLDIARPHPPTFRPTRLAEVIEGTLSFLSEKFERRGIQVLRQLGDAPPVLADPDKLQQVFLNLYVNAVDAMPGGGALHIALDCDERGWPRVQIADTGTGIAPEDLPRVFEAFYTTKGAGAGSGLGLAVARSIVRDHGGTIEVESRIGRGTRFWLALPPVPPQTGDEPPLPA